MLTVAVEVDGFSDASAAFSAAFAAADLNENPPVLEPNGEPIADGVPKGDAVAGILLVTVEVAVVDPSDFSAVVADGKGEVVGLKPPNMVLAGAPPNAPNPVAVGLAEVSED